MRLKGFTWGTYSGRSFNAASDRCKNLYPESVKGGNPENESVLLGTPGHNLFIQWDSVSPLFDQTLTAIYKEPNTGRVFAISNGILYEIRADRSVTVYASRSYLNVGVVSFASNSRQMMITQSLVPNVAHIYDIDTMFVHDLIVGTTAGFLGAVSVRMIDNYFIVRSPAPASRQFQICAPFDGLTWDAADVATSEGGPDAIVGDIDSHREYWMFGSERGEVFSDTGAFLFPFERINSIAIEQGLAAAEAIIKIDSKVYWLSQNKDGSARVVRADGYNPVGVSDRATEWWFNQYAKHGGISDAKMFGYQDEDGHSFLVITFPSVTCEPSATGEMVDGVVNGATWVYDIAENQWHERTYLDPVTGKEGAVLGIYHTFAFGKHLVGGGDHNIYELTTDCNQDNGKPVKRVRRFPHIVDELKNIKYSKFQLSCAVGNVPVGSSDHVVNLRVSNNAGATWSNYYPKSLGFIGEYLKVLIWKALGSARRRVFELSTTVNAPTCWTDAFINGEETGSDGV